MTAIMTMFRDAHHPWNGICRHHVLEAHAQVLFMVICSWATAHQQRNSATGQDIVGRRAVGGLEQTSLINERSTDNGGSDDTSWRYVTGAWRAHLLMGLANDWPLYRPRW